MADLDAADQGFNRSEAIRLLEGYRDGTLDEEAARQLAQSVHSGDATGRWFLEELQFAGLLGQTFHELDDRAFMRSFFERLSAEQGEDAFAERIKTRARQRRRQDARQRRFSSLSTTFDLLFGQTPERSEEHYQEATGRRGMVFALLASVVAIAIIAGLALHNLSPSPTAELLENSIGVVVIQQGVEQPPDGRIALRPGDGIRVPPEGSALVYFPDSSWLRLGSAASVTLSPTTRDGQESLDRGGKRVELLSGILEAEIKPQPDGRPCQFITPHAVIEASSSHLTITVTGASSRAECTAGTTRIIRRDDGSAVTITAGQTAIAAQGMELKAHPK